MKVKLRNKDIRENYVEELLNARGVTDIDEFLRPTEMNLQSWTALKNIEAGLDLMYKAIEECWNILIPVDSDMDGYCSAATMYNWLQEYDKKQELYGRKVDFIVHEAKQHGLEDIVERIDLNNYDIVIIPDASTNDDKYFKQYPNIHFLVLDHHERENDESFIPSNAIVINNQMSPDYKNKALCGTGVTWQFCRGLDDRYGSDFAEDLIDLVAAATVADMMSVTTLENRYILKKGLMNIKNGFLQALVEKQSYSLGDSVTPVGVAFYIAPLINSMTRMGTLDEKERMFLAFADSEHLVPCLKRGAKGTMEKVAIESARECTNTRTKQKKLQDQMSELVEMQIVSNGLLDNKLLVITLDENFDDIPSEINGLSGNKISKKYKRPTLILRQNKEGYLKGSGRGVETLDMPGLKGFLESSGMFSMLAGHEGAFGAHLKAKDLPKLIDWANEQLKDVDMNEDVWEVDFIRERYETEDIAKLIYALDLLGDTWGQQNDEPVIAIKNINIKSSDIALLGKVKKDTVKITKDGISYMLFKCSQETIDRLTQYPEAQLDIVGTMNVNEFAGNLTPQIFIKDFEVRDGRLCF